MSRADPSPGVTRKPEAVAATPAPGEVKADARHRIEDELRILVSAEGVRVVDDLALFGLTPSESDRGRRKPRHI